MIKTKRGLMYFQVIIVSADALEPAGPRHLNTNTDLTNISLCYYIPHIRRIGGCYGFTSKPPAACNGVNAITQKPRDGLFSNLVYTLVVIVS